MKKSIYTLAIAMFIAGSIFTGCKSSSKKVEDAKDKVEDAQDKVDQAKAELNQVIQDSILQFKKESEAKIAAHEKSIAEFKTRIASEKKENKAKYEKKLAELEQKNSDMKKRLDEYKAEGKENWETFKDDFTKDMEALSEGFRELAAIQIK
jgi:phage shock protein A